MRNLFRWAMIGLPGGGGASGTNNTPKSSESSCLLMKTMRWRLKPVVFALIFIFSEKEAAKLPVRMEAVFILAVASCWPISFRRHLNETFSCSSSSFLSDETNKETSEQQEAAFLHIFLLSALFRSWIISKSTRFYQHLGFCAVQRVSEKNWRQKPSQAKWQRAEWDEGQKHW